MSFYSSIYQEEQSYCHQPDSSRLNEFKAMLNKNSKSFLLNFPPIPFSNVIHGCYESNSQFNYGFSTEFDANLLKKHELPLSDQIVDILAETHSQPNYHQNSQQIDRVPILKRLSNKYFELGACAVLEEITALSPAVLKKNKIPELVVSAAAMIVRFIDIINAPISPLFITNKEQFELASLKGNCWQKKSHQSCSVASLQQQVRSCLQERLSQGLLTQPAARSAEASKTGVGHMLGLEAKLFVNHRSRCCQLHHNLGH